MRVSRVVREATISGHGGGGRKNMSCMAQKSDLVLAGQLAEERSHPRRSEAQVVEQLLFFLGAEPGAQRLESIRVNMNPANVAQGLGHPAARAIGHTSDANRSEDDLREFRIEIVGVERPVGQPVKELAMLRMLRIVDRFQHFVIPRHATAVFRRTLSRTVDELSAHWTLGVFGNQLQFDDMLPAIAKIVGVPELVARFFQKLLELVQLFILRRIIIVMFRDAKPLAVSSGEFMHVTIVPAHRGLEHLVKR